MNWDEIERREKPGKLSRLNFDFKKTILAPFIALVGCGIFALVFILVFASKSPDEYPRFIILSSKMESIKYDIAFGLPYSKSYMVIPENEYDACAASYALKGGGFEGEIYINYIIYKYYSGYSTELTSIKARRVLAAAVEDGMAYDSVLFECILLDISAEEYKEMLIVAQRVRQTVEIAAGEYARKTESQMKKNPHRDMER